MLVMAEMEGNRKPSVSHVDMEAISPISTSVNRELSVIEVMKYFTSYADKVKPSFPPYKPKAGDVYLYFINDKRCKS